MAIFSGRFLFSMIFIFVVSMSILVLAEDGSRGVTEINPQASATNADDEFEQSGLADLAVILKNGQPTLAYFYQSVACSCVAAQCALADTIIDSVSELKGKRDGFNFAKVDIFFTDAADSLYHVDVVPVFIYYNDKGHEINRFEWDVSVDLLKQLINNPAKKLEP
jgi:hypothetical protein